MIKKLFLFALVASTTVSCCSLFYKKDQTTATNYDKKKAAMYGVPEGNKLSASMMRAMEWPERDNSWFIEYNTMPLKGDFAYEDGVVRRDPSAILKIDGLYYVWYSRSTGPTDGFAGDMEHDKVFPWDRCDIWYATSKDGITWKEEGVAVARGEKGSYDDRSVFTTEIMEWEGKYYLCYQAVKSPYTVRVKNTIAMAWSDSPRGPWTKTAEPVLTPSDSGEWLGEDDNRFKVVKKGDFDSHKVHDPCIIPFKGKFYMYYKGERMGEEITWGGREIKHGLAIADSPLGPYVKSEYNPISNSGHEICVWPYNGGIAALVTTDGVEKNTIQWSPDGINFEIMTVIKGAPEAIGLNRSADNEKSPTEILRWGLTHVYNTWNYQSIMAFETWNMTIHAAKGESVSRE
ncbi:MAG: family 43 glycosylhydrolase [Rikenellaceae bacterium]